jgi:hypothetical protein
MAHFTSMRNHYEFGALSDELIIKMAWLHAFFTVLSGAFLLANQRLGGLFLTLSMCTLLLSRDNPFMSISEHQWRSQVSSAMKDLALAGVGILLWTRK